MLLPGSHSGGERVRHGTPTPLCFRFMNRHETARNYSRVCAFPGHVGDNESRPDCLQTAEFAAISIPRGKFRSMLLLESLPTVIGAAAIAPALLMLWLVIAADERPGPPAQVWIAFLLGAASISLLGIARAPFAAILAVSGNPWMTQGAAFGFRRRRARRDRQGARDHRGVVEAPHVRRPDGHRGLWRGGRPRLRGLRKPRLSGAACRHVAVAGGVAQRADRAVPRRARHHRRRLSRDRAGRHRARREPASPRLGAHLELGVGVDRARRAACGVRFSAADAAEESGSRIRRPG